jgi:hypothetical protein
VVVVWSAVSLVVGLLVGRVLRHRDEQVPHVPEQAWLVEWDRRGEPARDPERSRPR